MSMLKQLWISIAAVALLALGGSLVVSTLSARHYLAQQLRVKNIDNASSLALSMSQMPKDPVTLELLISAQFDAGHYQYIRLYDPEGRPLVARESVAPVVEVPEWFVQLVPIDAEEGVALVQDGWNQFGTLRVKSHSRFVYLSLWEGTVRLLAWFVAGGIGCGLAGTLMLRRVVGPLGSVVDQAQAIGERRFLTLPEPRTRELQALVRAMNSLADRVRTMLEEESARLEALRRSAQNDPLTGLLNRENFVVRLEDALANENASPCGTLAVVRVPDLASINDRQGREAGDAILCRLADAIESLREQSDTRVAGRLGGTDVALLLADDEDPAALARDLPAALDIAAGRLIEEFGLALPIGIAAYRRGDAPAQVLAHADLALAKSRQAGDGRAVVENVDPHLRPVATLASWRSEITDALGAGRLTLKTFPVLAADGSLLHREGPVRLRLTADGPWITAGEFMPWAARAGLVGHIDAAVVDRALALLDTQPGDICINLSSESMCHGDTVSGLAERLAHAPGQARRLWIDLPEAAAFRHSEEFRRFCRALKPLGCRVGLEHVGRYVARIGELHDVGLDYLKIDSTTVRGIDANPGTQTFLRGLATIAHTLGILVIAEGVGSEDELHLLASLGLDGMTGPAVAER